MHLSNSGATVMTGPSNHDDAANRPDEDARLAAALYDSDNLLRDSLREEDRRRRVRRLVLFSLVGGGIVMGTVLFAVAAGWLTLFAPAPEAQQAVDNVDKEAWVVKLTGLRDHMHTAFGVGPDLTLIDPDAGLEIVKEAWPKIKEPQVKTGLLKTFAFSKALPKKHDKVLEVLDIGMKDDDPDVRTYAAAYVAEYSGKDFGDDAAGYKTWFAANGKKDPNTLLAAAPKSDADVKTKPTAVAKKVKKPADRKAAIAQAEQLSNEGWQLWQQQNMAEAAKKFEQAVELDPSAANSWNGLGWARFNSGDSENAVEAFEKCVEIERNHPAGLNGLGQIYLMWGDLDKAEKYFLRAVKSPQASAAWYGLGRLYLVEAKYDKAVPWLRKALAEQPDDASLKSMLEAAEKKSVPAELEKQLKPAGKPESTPAAKSASEGWQQFFAGNARSAEMSFNRALAKDPENLSGMNGLGFVLLNSGKVDEAKPYFEKCLEKEPDAAGPMNGLARCLKEEGKVDEAIALWEKMAKTNPGPNAATTGLATTYLERKEYAKAIPYFEELVKAEPNKAEYKKGLAEAQAGAKPK
jgi:tetratricopeptide (TPR) repeat protein